MGLFGREKKSDAEIEAEELAEAKAEQYTVTIHGPQGLIETLLLKEQPSWDDTSVNGTALDDKEVAVVGLGGVYFAIIKQGTP